jgi:hypothetical protein
MELMVFSPDQSLSQWLTRELVHVIGDDEQTAGAEIIEGLTE